MRETRVERALTTAVKARSGWAIKLTSVAGIPDRMVLLPGGRIIFVELKAPGRSAEAHQLVVHGRLRRLGFQVEVLSSVSLVEEWAATL